MASDSGRGDPCSGLGPWAGVVLTRVGWVVLTKEQWRNEAETAAGESEHRTSPSSGGYIGTKLFSAKES